MTSEANTVAAMNMDPEMDMFALAYVEHGGNLKKAYEEVYGPGVYQAVAKAQLLLSNPQVIARIGQLQQVTEDACLLSMSMHLNELANIRDLAKVQGSLKVALEAEVKRGTVVGFYVNKTIEAPSSVPPPDSLEKLADRLTGLIRKNRMEISNVQDAQIIDASTGEILPAAGHEAHAGGPQTGAV